MSFPEQLRQYRIALGYTQLDVAKGVGVDFSTYSCYELGKRMPNLDRLKRISEFLHVPTDVLLEVDAPMRDEAELAELAKVVEPLSDAQMRRTLWPEDGERMTERDLEKVYEYAEFLAHRKKQAATYEEV